VDKVVYFSNIYYHTSLSDPISGTTVALTSKVHASAMSVLLIVQN
jgi:hypothetical protein